MSKPKLLIVANVPSMLREFLLPFADHFSAKGWRVDALVSDAASCEECKAHFGAVYDVEWSRNPLEPKNFTKAPKTIRELVQRERYDLVHVHSPVAAFVTRFALRNMEKRPKVIYTAHGFHFHKGGHPVKNRIFLGLEKMAAPWTDYLVVMNREDERAAKTHKLIAPERLMYMPGIGVDTEKYSPKGVSEEAVTELRKELKLSPDEKLILMIAEFNPGKRHRDALQAFKKLERTDVVMAFAGLGPLEEEIEALAKELGLEDRTRFLGYRRDIPVLLLASHALLLPSEREGLPRSIMEAFCLGTPVISTNIRGVEDLLADDAGIMTGVGDVDGIADAMKYMLEHPDEAKQMGLNGQERMKDFDLNEVKRLHEELYQDALGEVKEPDVALV